MPLKDPKAGVKRYTCPWPKYVTLKNIKKVADWWCGGDCDRARKLPLSLFIEVLACAVAEDEGAVIAADAAEQESKRNATHNGMMGVH